MTEHLTAEVMNDYARMQMRPADLLNADDHLITCEECRRQMGDEEGIQEALRSVQEDFDAVAASLPARPGVAAADRTMAAGAAIRNATDAVLPASILVSAPGISAPDDSPEPDGPPRPRRAGLIFGLGLGAGILAAAAAAAIPALRLTRRDAELEAELERLRQSHAGHADQAAEISRLRSDLALSQQDTMTAAAAAPAPVTLHDAGGQVGLDANGDLLGLDTMSIREGHAIAAALRRRSVEVPDLQGLQPDPGGAEHDPGFGVSGPDATRVRATRPILSWTPLEGAVTYTVVLSSGGAAQETRSESLKRTSWKPPQALRRGAIYAWRVVARRADGSGETGEAVTRTARFQVLDQATASALERDLRSAGKSRLAAGVLLAQAGLIEESLRELKALAEANPESPEARALLASVELARPEPPLR